MESTMSTKQTRRALCQLHQRVDALLETGSHCSELAPALQAIAAAIHTQDYYIGLEKELKDAARQERRPLTGPIFSGVVRPDTDPTPAQEYGEFRVAWTCQDGHVASHGAGLGWNEDKATSYCAELKEASGRECWIEHQNPETGEWRRW